jgi:hypothetical protein
MATATSSIPGITPGTNEQKSTAATSRPVRTPRTETEQIHPAHARYFLGKQATDGNSKSAPELGSEVASEGDALVEALRLGATYFVVEEYRSVPHFEGKNPQLKREPVVRK